MENANNRVHCVSQSPDPKLKIVSHLKMTFSCCYKDKSTVSQSRQKVFNAKLPILILKAGYFDLTAERENVLNSKCSTYT